MSLMKYSDVLKLCKEKVAETMAPLRAKEMKKKGELEVAQLESKLAQEDQKVQEIATKYPLDFNALSDALDERDLVERRRDQLVTILKDLFPSDEDVKLSQENN